ncbi:hypothetical protein TWF694_001802 [Orbilia ellipsospora]|uniref:Uncharacterized protein n=1 Tax=Orbilia ellipsospora TaxID=2528407 RepID=A0AAV9X3Y7_9PEZI
MDVFASGFATNFPSALNSPSHRNTQIPTSPTPPTIHLLCLFSLLFNSFISPVTSQSVNFQPCASHCGLEIILLGKGAVQQAEKWCGGFGVTLEQTTTTSPPPVVEETPVPTVEPQSSSVFTSTIENVPVESSSSTSAALESTTSTVSSSFTTMITQQPGSSQPTGSDNAPVSQSSSTSVLSTNTQLATAAATPPQTQQSNSGDSFGGLSRSDKITLGTAITFGVLGTVLAVIGLRYMARQHSFNKRHERG